MIERTRRAAQRSRRWGALLLPVLLLPVLTGGCGTGPDAGPGPGSGPPTSAGSPAAGSPADSTTPDAAAAGFSNPVYALDFPDPMVIKASGAGYVAVATNGNGSNVQTLTSPDLVSWEQGADALPNLPSWSSPGKVWAPEVAVRADGKYVLYYTTRGPNPNIQCIGVAVGSRAGGPFVDSSKKPLVCERDQGGSIDANAFTAADGARYLYWKNDGNAVGVDTWISGQRLDASGTELVGKPKQLFKQDLSWEGNLVEAPFGWEHDGTFSLFYSANAFDSDAYAVGQATAKKPLGPFTKNKEPVLESNEVAAGPGHCALIEKGGKVWMAYHAWSPDAVGSDPGRTMWLSEVNFAKDGRAQVTAPTVDQPTAP